LPGGQVTIDGTQFLVEGVGEGSGKVSVGRRTDRDCAVTGAARRVAMVARTTKRFIRRLHYELMGSDQVLNPWV
jgi:hypothetical protein